MGQQWPATGTEVLAAADLGGTECGLSPLGGGRHQLHCRAAEQTTTNWRKITPKKFSHYCKSPQQISQPVDLAKGLRTPREFDNEDQRDLVTELTQDWENRMLEGTTKSCATMTQEKEQ